MSKINYLIFLFFSCVFLSGNCFGMEKKFDELFKKLSECNKENIELVKSFGRKNELLLKKYEKVCKELEEKKKREVEYSELEKKFREKLKIMLNEFCREINVDETRDEESFFEFLKVCLAAFSSTARSFTTKNKELENENLNLKKEKNNSGKKINFLKMLLIGKLKEEKTNAVKSLEELFEKRQGVKTDVIKYLEKELLAELKSLANDKK